MTTILSRNEIRAEVEKAIRGVGVSWGMAKDGGVMAAWMAGHDLPFLGALNHCLEVLNETHGLPDHNAIDCVASYQAIALAEYVAAAKTSWSGRVLMPRALVAGMGIVAEEQDICFTLTVSGQVVAAADRHHVWLNKKGIASGVFDVVLSAGEVKHEGLARLPWAEQIAHEAKTGCWQKVGKFASRTYVPETEEKRQAGAGAGDIDNT